MRSRDNLLRHDRHSGMPLDWKLYFDSCEEVKTKPGEVEKGYYTYIKD